MKTVPYPWSFSTCQEAMESELSVGEDDSRSSRWREEESIDGDRENAVDEGPSQSAPEATDMKPRHDHGGKLEEQRVDHQREQAQGDERQGKGEDEKHRSDEGVTEPEDDHGEHGGEKALNPDTFEESGSEAQGHRIEEQPENEALAA